MIKHNCYVYMDHLRALDSHRLSSKVSETVTPQDIYTPLNKKNWALDLSVHPDKAFANYILDGITNGFHIGFDRSFPLQSTPSNLPMASSKPEVISEYLLREVTFQ